MHRQHGEACLGPRRTRAAGALPGASSDVDHPGGKGGSALDGASMAMPPLALPLLESGSGAHSPEKPARTA
eukprot:6429297-Pyramimonas_sp.AAC.1